MDGDGFHPELLRNREIGLGIQGATTEEKVAEVVGPRKVRTVEREDSNTCVAQDVTDFLICDYSLQVEAVLLFTDGYVWTQKILGRTLISVLIVIVDDLRLPLYDLTL
jgi:hypothetical protein